MGGGSMIPCVHGSKGHAMGHRERQRSGGGRRGEQNDDRTHHGHGPWVGSHRPMQMPGDGTCLDSRTSGCRVAMRGTMESGSAALRVVTAAKLQ
ncbi:hypothetical protein GUJ93_ZPchr0003g17026 [Zizania palustris]|uniref:Uncharacterized protein n=1 Tax=Zizania palustris TaxID=103762 RepID=A0A8J5SHP3_ZIZPA|nr:hypothetical protein GUJ93_ZPchr0003g17026 [Zizania palustris]